MSLALVWSVILLAFAAATWLGRKLGMVSIISQLLLAAIGLPALLLLWIEPTWQLSGPQLLQADWIKVAYGLSFALLLGYILSDVVDVKVSTDSLKIALPSFFIPFVCGLLCALTVLQLTWLSAVAVGLLFAITAIPVLYLYLSNIGYPLTEIRRLMHAAILMDLMCWGLFALAQSSTEWQALAWPLLAALLPIVLRLLGIRHWLCYSLPYFALMLVMHCLHFNALIFGILYLLCMGLLRQRLRLPLPDKLWQTLQNYIAIPLILAFGVLQVDFSSAWQAYSWVYLGSLLLLPVLSKILGSWMGLHWASPQLSHAIKWREAVLLNIRGLTEIVFLNLLLQQQLIDATVYFSLLLMSLFSTLLPALLRIGQGPAPSSFGARESL